MLWVGLGLIAVTVAIIVVLLSPHSWIVVYPHRFLAGLFVKNPPIMSAHDEFPLSRTLEQNWVELAHEFDRVRAEAGEFPEFWQIDPIQRQISTFGGRKWTTFLVLAYGNWVTDNAQRCPLLTSFLAGDPSVVSAMYSVLAPRKTIPPHVGPFKGVLRYHLCLRAPRTGACYINVGDEVYTWRDGEGVIFDDTYLHSVVNQSDEERVVLFLDVRRTGAPKWIAWGDDLILWFLRHSVRVKAVVSRAQEARARLAR